MSLKAIRDLIGEGRLEEAAQACRRNIDAGDDPEARYLLAVVTGQMGRHDGSIALFERALRDLPDRADVAYNYGIILQAAGKFSEAVHQWSRAAALDPGHAGARFNLGRAYSEQGRWEEAKSAYEAAVAVDSENISALYNLGNVNFRLGHGAEAIRILERVVALDPAHVEGWINLGFAQLRGGAPEPAVVSLSQAVSLDPDNILAHFNLGQALLSAGRWRDGFAEMEWRRRLHKLPFPLSGQRAWKGENIEGKRILVYGEQGHGDVIQFLRYAKVLAENGAQVMVSCQAPLVGIANRADGIVDAVAFDEPPPPFDLFAPLMSLPHLLGATDAGDIPEAPYIEPPAISGIVPEGDGARVGLVWAGNPDKDVDVNRLVALTQFEPLLTVPGVRCFSLQVGSTARDINAAGRNDRLMDLGSGFTDFADTAAAIRELDLVVSVDTAVAHLAGAMGKPVWVLVPSVPDWRWGRIGDETPWYPSMRLFRRPRDSGWAPVVRRLIEELPRFMREKVPPLR